MSSRRALLGVNLAVVWSACSAADPWTTRDADLRAVDDPFIPPGAVRFFVTLDAASLPEWRVREDQGISQVSREIYARQGWPVVLLVRADRRCTVEIPSMHVSKTVVPDQPTVAWFLPTEAGVYDILVQASAQRCDGKLRVVGRETP